MTENGPATAETARSGRGGEGGSANPTHLPPPPPLRYHPPMQLDAFKSSLANPEPPRRAFRSPCRRCGGMPVATGTRRTSARRSATTRPARMSMPTCTARKATSPTPNTGTAAPAPPRQPCRSTRNGKTWCESFWRRGDAADLPPCGGEQPTGQRGHSKAPPEIIYGGKEKSRWSCSAGTARNRLSWLQTRLHQMRYEVPCA